MSEEATSEATLEEKHVTKSAREQTNMKQSQCEAKQDVIQRTECKTQEKLITSTHESHGTTPPKLSVSNRLTTGAVCCLDFQREETLKSDTPNIDCWLTQELSSHAIRETRRNYMCKLCQHATSPSSC